MSRYSVLLLIVPAVVVAVCADHERQNVTAAPETANSTDTSPVTVDEARRQATLLHETYLSTLLVVHREYFDEDERDTLPARAFEDVFREMDNRTHGSTRWISVNAPAMNVDHQPKPGFEQDAAEALSGGSSQFERIRNGVYHRAAGVPFAASCSKCHLSGLSQRRAGRMAGLVISLPLQNQ